MKLIRKILIAVALAAAVAGCKPTEENYKAAYDKAVAGREAAAASAEGDADVTEMRDSKLGEMEYKGVKYPISVQYVKITDGAGGANDDIRKYMVVASRFKQVFNARMMRDRLAESGYPGAFVVQNGDKYYFVVAGSYTELPQAIELYNKLKGDKPLQLKSPYPYFLCPSQIK